MIIGYLLVVVSLLVVMRMGPGGGFRPAEPPQGRAQKGGILAIIASPAVHRELKLSDEQVQGIRQLVQELRQRFGDRLSNANPEVLAEVRQGLLSALAEVFSPDQLRRFKQIIWQVRGFSAFADPEVQSALQLTTGEIDRLKSQALAAREQVKQTIQSTAPGTNRQQLINTLRRQAIEAAVADLGTERLNRWKELMGSTFDLSLMADTPRTASRLPFAGGADESVDDFLPG